MEAWTSEDTTLQQKQPKAIMTFVENGVKEADKMATLCKYCVAIKGATSKDAFETDEEFYNHVEMEHDIPVKRKGETHEQTMKRFKAKNKRAGTKDCQCLSCHKDPRYALVDSLNK